MFIQKLDWLLIQFVLDERFNFLDVQTRFQSLILLVDSFPLSTPLSGPAFLCFLQARTDFYPNQKDVYFRPDFHITPTVLLRKTGLVRQSLTVMCK